LSPVAPAFSGKIGIGAVLRLNGAAGVLERTGYRSKTRVTTWDAALRWYLWDGGFLAVGRSGGVVPPHAHHAIQIAMGLDRPVGISGQPEQWQFARGIIVMPDVLHTFDGNDAVGAMLFVDPESIEGAWLRTTVAGDFTIVPDARIERPAAFVLSFM
jgi:hypothetical protein